jgi:hypothetical protein
MKNVLVALAIFLFVSAAQASTANKKFVSMDNTVASNLCVIAAESGYKAAIVHASKTSQRNIRDIICNGKSIKRFSKRTEVKEVLVALEANPIESKVYE